MTRFFISLMAVVMLTFGSLESAEAKRFGGGFSFGKQSGRVTQKQATPPPAQNAAKPAAAGAGASAATKRPWGGMLGGLAAGLGLAWLAHSLGFGEGFANILLIALLAFAAIAVFRMVARSRSGGASRGGLAYGHAGASAGGSPTAGGMGTRFDASGTDPAGPSSRFGAGAGAAATGGSMIGSALAGSQAWGVPTGFDTEGFLQAAKRNFVSLQAAWDGADIPQLRAMMTDEMVNEIQAQLSDRQSHIGDQPNRTEVVELDAQLLGIEEMPDAYMASVEFSGLIREDAAGEASPFREVWNMTRPITGGGGWLVAGVQALQ